MQREKGSGDETSMGMHVYCVSVADQVLGMYVVVAAVADRGHNNTQWLARRCPHTLMSSVLS